MNRFSFSRPVSAIVLASHVARDIELGKRRLIAALSAAAFEEQPLSFAHAVHDPSAVVVFETHVLEIEWALALPASCSHTESGFGQLGHARRQGSMYRALRKRLLCGILEIHPLCILPSVNRYLVRFAIEEFLEHLDDVVRANGGFPLGTIFGKGHLIEDEVARVRSMDDALAVGRAGLDVEVAKPIGRPVFNIRNLL